MWYLCGIGSNIAPERHLPEALMRLAGRFEKVRVSRVLRTSPQGIDTRNSFLNALAVFQCPLEADGLKAWLVELEESLGRDRADPLSSVRDRPIDIDILAIANSPVFPAAAVTEEYYQGLISGVPGPGVELELAGQRLGEATSTIHRDQRSGYKVVVHQGEELLDHTAESAFPG